MNPLVIVTAWIPDSAARLRDDEGIGVETRPNRLRVPRPIFTFVSA